MYTLILFGSRSITYIHCYLRSYKFFDLLKAKRKQMAAINAAKIKNIVSTGISKDMIVKILKTARNVHVDLRLLPFKKILRFPSISITPITILYEI